MPLVASAQDMFSTIENPFGGDLSSVTISSGYSSQRAAAYRSTRNTSSTVASAQPTGTSFVGNLFSSNRRSSVSSSNSSYFSTGTALENYSTTSRVNSRQFGSNTTSSYVPFESDISSLTRSSRPAKIPGGDPIGGFVPLTDSLWLVALLVAAYVFVIYRRQQKRVKE